MPQRDTIQGQAPDGTYLPVLVDDTGRLIISGGGGGSSAWGGITGTLSDQTDLQSALNAKAPIDNPTFTTALSIENLQLDGNTIKSTNTNGNIDLDPNGSGKITIPNDTSIEFNGGAGGNNTSLKTGTDGTFLFDTGNTESIKFKGTSGAAWGYTDGSFNYVFQSDFAGNTIQSGAAAIGGAITSGGVAVPTISSTSTLTNKTLTAPVMTTPTLGVATATSVNKVAITAPATSATLTIANGKTLTANNSITLAGTDATTMTFPSSTDTIAGLAAVQTITGAWSFNDAKLILNGLTSGTTTLKSGAIAGTSVITLPVATDTLVGKATTDTLTNKTLTAPVLSGTLTGTYTIGGTPTFPATIVDTTTAQTQTNKRITKRVGTTASSATPTINTDNFDMYRITAQAAAITSFTTNLTGTPTDGQTIIISITDNGTARAITWGASFEASTVPLPTTTVISTRLDVGFVWNTVTSKWRCIAVA